MGKIFGIGFHKTGTTSLAAAQAPRGTGSGGLPGFVEGTRRDGFVAMQRGVVLVKR